MSKKALEALRSIEGMKLFVTSHAADMRGFGFRDPVSQGDGTEWYLHLQCPWRLQTAEAIVTGLFDWFEPADSDTIRGEGWDPATGGSLQEMRLRKLFEDTDGERGPVFNKTKDFVVLRVGATNHGDVTIDFTGGLQLRAFVAGSTGEGWRIFRKGDLSSHYVWAGAEDSGVGFGREALP